MTCTFVLRFRPVRALLLSVPLMTGMVVGSTFTVEPWMMKPLIAVFGTYWDPETHEIHTWHECIKGKAKVQWKECAK